MESATNNTQTNFPAAAITFAGSCPAGFNFNASFLRNHSFVIRYAPYLRYNGPYRKRNVFAGGEGFSPQNREFRAFRGNLGLECQTNNALQCVVSGLDSFGRGRKQAHNAEKTPDPCVFLPVKTGRLRRSLSQRRQQTASPEASESNPTSELSQNEPNYGLLVRALRANASKKTANVLSATAKLLAVAAFALLVSQPATARNYDNEAKQLAKISHPRARVDVIAKTLREIDRNLALHFPTGPFGREDLIAIALGESGFNHREINRRCVGELGIWQVRPEYFRPGEDGLQVGTNTRAAFRVLKSKHATAKRIKSPLGIRKATIICYNGYVRRNGKVDERYWRWFCHNRAKVAKALYVFPSKYRESRIVAKPPRIPVKRLNKKSPISNSELARQFEAERQLRNDVYGGQS